jgi:aminoglycoside phosphotransferase (APT) family kinase protein
MEAVALWRPARARQRRREVLYADQGRDEPLAARGRDGQQFHHAHSQLGDAIARDWEPEVVVDAALACALVDDQFHELAPASARLLAAGWDNTAYLVNDAFVFRFPRRAIAVPLLETEAALLPWLSRRLPLAIPNPEYLGRPSHQYGWPFAGYSWLPGQTLALAHPTLDDRRAIAAPLAEFLAALHATPVDEARARGAGFDSLDRVNVEKRRAATNARLQDLLGRGVLRDRRAIDDILNHAPPVTARADVLVHGDLHAGQMLADRERRLSAVIDWGDVHVGDPTVDFAAVHAVIPYEAHDVFLGTYGPIDPARWTSARARAVWHSVALLAHATAINDSDMAREAAEALDRMTGAR